MLATSCHYKAKHVRLTWLNIENNVTFHRNHDFGDVNNKLEKVANSRRSDFDFCSELLHLTKVITIPMWHYIPRSLNCTRIHHWKGKTIDLPFCTHWHNNGRRVGADVLMHFTYFSISFISVIWNYKSKKRWSDVLFNY